MVKCSVTVSIKGVFE